MPEPDGGKNVFTSKIAGAPAYVWVGGAAVLLGGFLWWRNKQNAQAQAQASTSSAVPSAATSEELMAAGLYQPPNITYNVPSPTIDNGVSVTPQPSSGGQPSAIPAGQFLGTDGVLYNASGFWWVGGVPYPKWQFSTPPPPGSPGSVGFLTPPQGWPFAPQTTGTTSGTVPAASGWSGFTAVPSARVAASRGTGAATPGARSRLAPTRAFAVKHPLYGFSPSHPAQGFRVA